jgi:hypothetical protein
MKGRWEEGKGREEQECKSVREKEKEIQGVKVREERQHSAPVPVGDPLR